MKMGRRMETVRNAGLAGQPAARTAKRTTSMATDTGHGVARVNGLVRARRAAGASPRGTTRRERPQQRLGLPLCAGYQAEGNQRVVLERPPVRSSSPPTSRRSHIQSSRILCRRDTELNGRAIDQARPREVEVRQFGRLYEREALAFENSGHQLVAAAVCRPSAVSNASGGERSALIAVAQVAIPFATSAWAAPQLAKSPTDGKINNPF